MTTGLSPGARQQAEKIRNALHSGRSKIQFSARQMQRPALRALQRWCDAQGIGASLRPDGAWLVNAADWRQLEQALQRLGLRPLDEVAATTRIARLRQGAEEHKGLGEQPLTHRILCSQPIAPPPLPIKNTSASARWAIDMDWRQLDLSAFDGLLVVENADVFYACGSADWQLPDGFGRFLVTYRGHAYRAHGLKALQRAWPTEQPQVYFGDVDPPGLRIALTEGYTHLLLPEFAAFRRAATRAHVPAKQNQALRWLQTTALPAYSGAHPLTPYLRILAEGRGLLQQAALHGPLVQVLVVASVHR